MLKVMKFGGSSLDDAKSLNDIKNIISAEEGSKAIVLSALKGITRELTEALDRVLKDEKEIDPVINSISSRHYTVIRGAVTSPRILSETMEKTSYLLRHLERLFYGIAYTSELTPRTRDMVLSYGERFSVRIMEGVFLSGGIQAKALDADDLGIITDGEYGNATADLKETGRHIRKKLLKIIDEGAIPLVTGFFGRTPQGHTTLFGFGGSDYSAAIVAHALDADVIEVWKDVDGFMSAQPSLVPEAHLIDRLSYEEAAELAYFGAKILHPRIVGPAELKNIPIRIKNTLKASEKETVIWKEGYESGDIIKSVTYSREIGVLRVWGGGVGYKPGVMKDLVTAIASIGVNIKSVITAQTCINILLEQHDLDACYQALREVKSTSVEDIEKANDLALVGVVGEGLATTEGLAARVFTSVARKGINVEMISFGARVAFYLLVKENLLEETIRAIHNEFFNKLIA
ncbi:MAG: aspartate kinase [Candidatus Eremiobacteraeota bacterium]|nr:aspartate kinase [Candidatus Eremiobacteraeota bacterium]